MTEDFRAVAADREAAHQAVTRGYAHAKALIDNGERVLITVGPALEPIGIQQRRFLHGPVLTQIAEQVRIDGQRYTGDVWKEYFRKLFLPDRYVMRRALTWDKKLCRLVQAKRATPHRERQSTETLGPRKYSEFIDQTIAHAVADLGVEFRFIAEERAAVQYRRPSKKEAPADAEA